jgi:curved DNA-binding protein CbpA
MSQTKKELFKEVISHFDYHWFWGLNYHEIVPDNNLALDVDALIEDEDAQRVFRNKLINIWDEFLIVVFIYWLFNIDNFRANIYTWAACIAHNEFVLTEEMRPIHFDLEGSGWDLGAINLFRTELNKLPLFEEQNTIPTIIETPDDLKLQFSVNPYMQPYLKTLEIIRGNGEFLGEKEIRKAFNRKALLLHPDKNNNSPQSNEAFIKLKEALDYFKSLAQLKDDSLDIRGNQGMNDFWMKMNKIDREIEQLKRNGEQIDRRTEQLKREGEQLKRETEQLKRDGELLDRMLEEKKRNRVDNPYKLCEDSKRDRELIEANQEHLKAARNAETRNDIVIDIDIIENSNSDYSTCQSTSSENMRSMPSSDTNNETSYLLVSQGLYAIKKSPKQDRQLSMDTYEGRGFETI